jgi:hypothetical protein
MQNKNKMKQLVKNNCACYFGDRHGISNYCCWKDGSCTFFDQDNPIPSCRYFENGVLPTDEKLERDYKLERNMHVERQIAKPKVSCKKCGTTRQILIGNLIVKNAMKRIRRKRQN